MSAPARSRLATEDVKRDIRDHALILEHIGNIEEMSLDMKATGAEPEDIFVFQLRGPKGTCELMAALVTTADGTERVQAGTIRLPDGRSFDLFPDGRRDLPALESDE